MVGRPTVFNNKLDILICEELAEGKSLRSIALQDGMPALKTLRRWLRDDEQFRLHYALARDEQADYYADEINDIAQLTLDKVYEPNAARVAIDAKKWIASKLKPKKYGDKIDMTTNGKDVVIPILGGATTVQNTNDDIIG